MAEKINKLILETEYRTTGDVGASVSKIEQLQVATTKAAKGTIELVEAEKKLEQASNAAGVSVSTETKKVNDLNSTLEKSKNAMDQIAQTNSLRRAMESSVGETSKINKLLDDFSKRLQGVSKISEIDKIAVEFRQLADGLSQEGTSKFIDGIADGAIKAQQALVDLSRETVLNPKTENIIGKASEKVLTLTKQLRDLRNQAQSTEDPEALIRITTEAGKLQDKITSTNEVIQALSSSTFFTDTLVEGAETAISAFTTLQGVITLVGGDEEELAKAAQKAQGALALLAGSQKLLSDLKKGDNIITRAQIVAQRAYTAVVGQSTGAMKGFKLALAATGVGLLVVGLIALVTNFEKVKSVLGLGVNPELEENVRLTREATAAANEQTESYKNQEEFLKSLGVTQQEISNQKIQNAENEIQALDKQVKRETEKLNELLKLNTKSQLVTANPLDIFSSISGPSDTEIQEQDKLVKDLIQRQKDLAVESNNESKTLKEIEDQRRKDRLDSIKKQGDDRLKILAEEERYALAIAGINRATNEELLKIQLKYANDRKRIQQSIPNLDRTEITKTENNIKELTAQISQVVDGSIADLSEKVAILRSKTTEGIAFGTAEFDAAVGELNRVSAELKKATDALNPTETEQFVEGSLNALRKQVTDLTTLIEGLNGETEQFLDVQKKLEIAREAVSALEKKIAGEKLENAKNNNLELLNEEERHQLAMLGIQGASYEDQLRLQLKFAQDRQKILEASAEQDEVAIKNGQNVILELEAQLNSAKKEQRKQDVLDAIDVAQQLIDTAIYAANVFVDIERRKVEQLIGLQQERVNEALKIADKGNVQILELEQERLDELNKKREKFVRKQQALAQIELITNSVLAIAKAAAQGGAAAPFTIAATLIALAAGLAQARAQAQAQSFKKGGIYSEKGGYTGYGSASSVSTALGTKPYEYHKDEHITPSNVLNIGQNKFWLEQIRLKKMDIGKMVRGNQSSAPVVINDNKDVVDAVRSIPGVRIQFDPRGIVSTVIETEKNRKRIKSKLR